MSVFVVDASVAAKWYAQEPNAEDALRLLAGAHVLHAPDFLLMEMDNVLCTWVRSGSFTRAAASETRAALRTAPVQLHPFQRLLDSSWGIAADHGVSLYDALYVALAIHLDAQLVTADRKLLRSLSGTPFARHVTWVEDVE